MVKAGCKSINKKGVVKLWNHKTWHKEFLVGLEDRQPEDIQKKFECLCDEEECLALMFQYGFYNLGFEYVDFITEEIPFLTKDDNYAFVCMRPLGVCFSVHLVAEFSCKPVMETIVEGWKEIGEKYDAIAAKCHETIFEVVDGKWHYPIDENGVRKEVEWSHDEIPDYNNGLQISSWIKENDDGNYEGHIVAASDFLTKMNFREIHTIALIMEHLGIAWNKSVTVDFDYVDLTVKR